MFLNGATNDDYIRYHILSQMLMIKCKRRATNRPYDHNWNCFNQDILEIVNELVQLLDNYLFNYPEYQDIKRKIISSYSCKEIQ